VEDIAARLGYGDTTNFSRTFRRWVGQTPSEVRSNTQGGAR
jgi:AraC-like DNA-binding protein